MIERVVKVIKPKCIICGEKEYVDGMCIKCYKSYQTSCVMGSTCPLDKNLPQNVFRWAVMRTKRIVKKPLYRLMNW